MASFSNPKRPDMVWEVVCKHPHACTHSGTAWQPQPTATATATATAYSLHLRCWRSLAWTLPSEALSTDTAEFGTGDVH